VPEAATLKTKRLGRSCAILGEILRDTSCIDLLRGSRRFDFLENNGFEIIENEI
jgi:hypothetical protein